MTTIFISVFAGFCFGSLISGFLLYRAAKKMMKKTLAQAHLVLEAQDKGHLLRVITNIPDQEESA